MSNENVTFTQTSRQNRKPSGEKYLPPVKSTSKKETLNTVKTKNDIKLSQEKTLLSLHPTDSSGTEDDDMSQF